MSKLGNPNSIPVTAVFDIGKTNKKFFLFDENYAVVLQQQTSLDQTVDEDGDPCENLRLLEYWIQNKLRDIAESKKYDIQRLNFSTYGASFVHLDGSGKPKTPLYSYLKPYPENVYNGFYEMYGGKKQLSLQTASPPMGLLNSGFQLFWLKRQKPMIFEDIDCSLHFPQYLSYMMTGKKVAELTSIGCHTTLWNYTQNEYHQWLKQENCLGLLPEICSVSGTTEAEFHGIQSQVGVGIHDSSAALAPYLLALDDPFMLVSTGTWSITFNPFNDAPLTYRELQKDCLCYLDIDGSQVKASRFFLGNEYMHQKQKLANYFDSQKWQDEITLDVDLLNALIEKSMPASKLKLEQAYSSGPYPQDKPGDWNFECFDSYKEAYHQLMLDLVAIQAESIKLAQGKKEIDKLIVTGGFSQNDFFVTLLASFFPEKKIFTSSLPNASALGAAMAINKIDKSPEGKANLKKLLTLKHRGAVKGIKAEDYSWKKTVVS